MVTPVSAAVRILWVQGFFYVVSGLWPLAHMPSFLAVTGFKRELWLVRTVGLLITVAGLALLAAARARRVSPEIVVLGAGFALCLAAVDVTYVSQGVIPRIYLADAVVEAALAIALLLSWRFARE